MALSKLQFRSGVNKETTSYSNEGGWFDVDKVRFRSGFPEKIGGWTKQSENSFLGTCRSLHPWVALDGSRFVGVGTNRKYYIESGAAFYDITPVKKTVNLTNPFTARNANLHNTQVSATDTTIRLVNNTAASAFAPSGIIKIGSEIITYTGTSGDTLTGCARGQEGTTAAVHAGSSNVSSSTIKVSHTDHEASIGDFVIFSGATSLGGNINASVLNQEYEVSSIIDGNNYQIQARTVSTIQSITVSTGLNPTYLFSSTSDTSSGGAVTLKYLISAGLDTSIFGTGWGAGTFGRGSWNSSASISAPGQALGFWSHDNFGQNLLINSHNGNIYYWQFANGLESRATALSDLAGADGLAPTVSKQVMVSDKDRHTIVFGCDPETDIGVQDPMLIRFSSQESLTTWGASSTNTAGDLRLGSGSEIVCAVETKQQIIVFTDTSVYAMQFLGPPFTFGINMISDNTTISGAFAPVGIEDSVFWMGLSEFYSYDGTVKEIPCTVKDFVFKDFNQDQRSKVYAASNTAFSEVWWFYPSASSFENNRYVVYNYGQNIWYYGSMSRTAWIDRGISALPVAAGTDHYLYRHESGFDDGSTSPATPISAYIESSQMSIGDGENFVFISKIIPDLTFRNSTANTPSATMTVKARNFPGGQYLQTNSSAVSKEVSSTVEKFTDQLYVRIRGRSFAFKIQSSSLGETWRLGSPRVDVRPDGRR